jgi:hypothetical protein
MCVLDVIKLVIIYVVIIMGCAVFSAFSSFLYGHAVAGIFRLTGCDAGLLSVLHVGGSVWVLCVSVRSPLLERSLYARYGSLCSGIYQIGTAYANAVSRGESIWLGWL